MRKCQSYAFVNLLLLESRPAVCEEGHEMEVFEDDEDEEGYECKKCPNVTSNSHQVGSRKQWRCYVCACGYCFSCIPEFYRGMLLEEVGNWKFFFVI